jgi:hypothetical protein
MRVYLPLGKGISNYVTFHIEDTLLYKEYKERIDHILRNKWYMSERAGKDVGYEKALLDFLINKKKYLNEK